MGSGQKEIGEEVTTHITGERRQRKIMGDGNIFPTQGEQLFPFSQTRDNSDHLKVASVFVEWVVAEVHQAGDLNRHFDVKGDFLGPASHNITFDDWSFLFLRDHIFPRGCS